MVNDVQNLFSVCKEHFSSLMDGNQCATSGDDTLKTTIENNEKEITIPIHLLA